MHVFQITKYKTDDILSNFQAKNVQNFMSRQNE